MLALLFACSDPPPDGELIFVRDGVVIDDGLRRYVSRPWTPGEEVTVEGITDTAPAVPECVPLFSEELGKVDELVASGGAAPHSSLAFSPDDRLLAVGSYLGEVVLLDAWTGRVRARKQLAETMIKQVVWSDDGDTLYVGEQSPDGNLYALDPTTLEARWTWRAADVVDTSTPPAGEDLYGVYSLPGIYGVELLESGELVASAVHGWNTEAGRLNKSKVVRISPAGEVLAQWPAEGTADATIFGLRTDGRHVVVGVNRSADGPDPDLPIHGVQVLALPDLEPVFRHVEEPLAPHYDKAFLWEAVDLDAGRVLLGYGDGRVRVVGLDGETVSVDAGTPILAGDVPIGASVGFGFFLGDGFAYSTSGTVIPWGAAAPELRPPTLHPNENAIWVHDADGSLRWTWRGEQQVAGFVRRGDHLVVGAGDRRSDARRDLYGAVVLRLAGEGSGAERLEAFCATEGPVFFRQDMTADGRVAVIEYPYVEGEGVLRGAYRVTVLR